LCELKEVNFDHLLTQPLDSLSQSAATDGCEIDSVLDNGHQFLATGLIRDCVQIHYPIARHNDGSCYLMADGHARWCLPKSVSGGQLTTSPTSCTTVPADYSAASGTACKDSTIVATFNPI
jgi:prepilin-type processing-associated H-X9-DG protein